MLKYIISRHFILTRLPEMLQPQSIFANSSKSNVLWDCNLVSRHLLAITLHQSSKSKVGRGGGAAGFTLKILVIHLILKDLNLIFVKDTNNFKNPNRCTQYMEDIFISQLVCRTIHHLIVVNELKVTYSLYSLWKELYWIRTQQLKINSQQIA